MNFTEAERNWIQGNVKMINDLYGRKIVELKNHYFQEKPTTKYQKEKLEIEKLFIQELERELIELQLVAKGGSQIKTESYE